MQLPKQAVEKTKITYFCTLLLLLAGIASYFALGQLEDPEFTIKSAAIVTKYPGASPFEVEQEVTEPLELALQELHQVDYLESFSRAGQSYITIDLKGKYRKDSIPQIFDEIRRKVTDTSSKLPPGALAPVVIDDIGEIFGFLLAVVGDGFSPQELKDYADDVKRELSLVKGAARVDMWGDQEQIIYVDVAQNQLAELGISPQTLYQTLSEQNLVVNAGHIDVNDQRIRIEALGAFSSPEEIENLTFRASAVDRFGKQHSSDSDSLVRLKDFASVRRGYREPPKNMMRFNGQPSVGLAVAVVSGGNVVELGTLLDEKIEELKQGLPIGIEFHKVAWQSEQVQESIVGFMVSLVEAVLIVLVILWLAMGRQNALIVGTALIMTILATFVIMALYHIDLQRMSLGALVIALGMMVDNAIVVADGATVRMQMGMNRVRAAVEAATSTAMPLLGATVIAVSFFYPIYGSTESVGEYCASLFQVVGISLMVSWVVSMTITPLQCVSMLDGNEEGEGVDPHSGSFFLFFRRILVYALRFRFLALGIAVAALLSSVFFFPYVPKMFFPDSSRLQFMVDYWAPEGTRIQQVSDDLRQMEEKLLDDDRIAGVAAFIGQGPPRFYLPVEPEKPYQSYAQLIVNIKDLNDLSGLIEESENWIAANIPQALVRIRKYAVGPGVQFKFEARIGGPGSVSEAELRRLGEEGMDILHASPLAKDVRTNWRQRVTKMDAAYQEDRGRWTSISRADMGRGLLRSYDGISVGQYREDDNLIPIVVRAVQSEREHLGNLDMTQLSPNRESDVVPLAQVASLSLGSENPMIWRRDRRRTITIQAEPDGATLSELRADVISKFEEMDLPPGYTMEWGGEYENSNNSQKSLLPGMMPVGVTVALLLVLLFNSYRPPLVVILVIPFAFIGMTYGLLLSNIPFGFMALLGAMSLAGMMIKNAIVLLDQVSIEKGEGHTPYESIIRAALSRLRPVCLAAGTTILGVVPLLQDVFWVSMAVVIMGGLACGTILTMILVPVLYATVYGIHEEEESE